MLKKYKSAIIIFLFFEIIAFSLYFWVKDIFFLFNFTYIGTALGLCQVLYINKFKYARNITQFAVGGYLLIYIGLICQENMAIEGFWYYLFLGLFQAAVVHYLVAKIFGPVFFGRGWCGYCCWTAMVLDLLPYKKPAKPRKAKTGGRYILFFLSLGFVVLLFLLSPPDLNKIMFYSFIIGNILYYASGIALAFILKDNRAFCKYLCPITVFLKPASYFSLLRVKNKKEQCINCGKCRNVCPMEVDMTDNSRRRHNGTECILCLKCIEVCPQKSLYL